MEEEGAIVVHDSLSLEVGKAVTNMGRGNSIGASDFTDKVRDKRGKNTIVGRFKIVKANLEILELLDACSKVAKPNIRLDPENGLGLEELISLYKSKVSNRKT